MELTDKQGEVITSLLLEEAKKKDPRGRKPRYRRAVLERILWILRTGARWKDMFSRFPPYQTCYRRFQEWVPDGRLERVVRALATDPQNRGGIDLSETYIDDTFFAAKNKALELVRPKRGKGYKVMAIADRLGLPVAVWAGSASPH